MSKETPKVDAGDLARVREILNSRKTPSQPQLATEINRLDPLKRADLDDRNSDRNLKELYAKWFIGILIGQLLLMNAVIVGNGVGCLKLEESVLKLYMSGTLLEIFGVVLVITKYLFKRSA
ncbi:hypothetical protein [Pseudomonas extremaustralis]|uniref:hypothetical protein n=1 Tax=Pseudomonas extremaustralis TaxID=359110 RepID=UPI002AA76042|nr:hypothetical protein [Pseudomonas extremaustralis]